MIKQPVKAKQRNIKDLLFSINEKTPEKIIYSKVWQAQAISRKYDTINFVYYP